MELDVINKKQCTGCMACKNACPKNAIIIEEDSLSGFLYPKTDKELCINCNICTKVCPIKNKLSENPNEIKVYACKNKNDEIRMKSSSGGIFTLIANYILEQNGIVFGAGFNENFEVIHTWTDSEEGLEKFRGSKYLQSQIGNAYQEVKSFLLEGRKVLFTGTPCQVEGLLSYLRKDYENLYTQDIICHGVPSPKVWRKFLEYKKKIHNEVPLKINFRKKEIAGWNSYHTSFTYSHFEENTHHADDSYMKFFLRNFDLRDTCYDCNFKKLKRKSDITVADFWGINNVRPEINDEKGTSSVLINSEKGKELFENIKNDIVYTKEHINSIIENNPCICKSTYYNGKREDFFEDLDKEPFENLIDKYL